MTDPNNTDTTQTATDGELPETDLDAVTGGVTWMDNPKIGEETPVMTVLAGMHYTTTIRLK